MSEATDKVAELEAENERLRGENGKLKNEALSLYRVLLQNVTGGNEE